MSHLSNSYKIDNKVMLKEDRPYIGVILEINNIKYFAPLTSAKKSRSKLNPQTTLKIFDKNNNFLGAIRFNNMIPCKDSDLDLIEISKIENVKYKRLLNEQYKIIKYKEKDRILKKALKLYDKKINNPNDYISKLCCDFKKLEENLK